MERQKTQNNQHATEEKNKVGGLMLPDNNIYYKVNQDGLGKKT